MVHIAITGAGTFNCCAEGGRKFSLKLKELAEGSGAEDSLNRNFKFGLTGSPIGGQGQSRISASRKWVLQPFGEERNKQCAVGLKDGDGAEQRQEEGG